MDFEFLPKIVIYLQLLLSCALCGSVIYFVYRRTSPNTVSEAEFASTVLVLSVATAFLVSIIKDSFALSIGLIGVLSIVRFRNSVKSPRQLTYIFVAVALGIANGAGEYLLAGLGTGAVALLLFYFPVMPFDLLQPRSDSETVSIVARLTSQGAGRFDMNHVSGFLTARGMSFHIKETTRTNERSELVIHFYDCDIGDVDEALQALNGTPSLVECNLEFELRNKMPANAGI